MLTLSLTIIIIVLMVIFKNHISNIPVIAILVVAGIAVNWSGYFQTYSNLCSYKTETWSVDCEFYILKWEALIMPQIHELLGLIPAALVLTAVLIF